VHRKQLLNVMTGKAMNAGIPDSTLEVASAKSKRFEDGFSTKAITTSGAGAGLELMNVEISSVLMARLYLSSQLAQAFLASEIQMPTNNYTFPLVTTRPTYYAGVGESVQPSGSNPGSAKLQLAAQKLISLVQYSYEADEDSVIAILPMITQQLGVTGADALENAILNGSTNYGLDSDVTIGLKPNDVTTAFDGIRKLSLNNSLSVNCSTGGITTANITAVKKKIGKWGINPADLLLVFGPSGYNDALLLPEALTAEKAGSQGVTRFLTGVVPNILGIDVIVSPQVRENVNASGLYDGTTTTKGLFYLIHKPSWIQGVRRGFTIEQWKDPRAQSNYIIASFRRALAPMEPLSTISAAAVGYAYNA
jgi:hypothetical protein